jgi:hypothetical protein
VLDIGSCFFAQDVVSRRENSAREYGTAVRRLNFIGRV